VAAIYRNACAVRVYVIGNYIANIIVDGPFDCRPVLDYDMYNNNISEELRQTNADRQDEININKRHTYYIL
jgi:hypothetical protein